jgi:thioredoxin-related protein
MKDSHPMAIIAGTVYMMGLAVLLSSCAKFGGGGQDSRIVAFGETDDKPIIRTSNSSGGTPLAVTPAPTPAPGTTVNPPGFTAEEDIMFTNADDPESSLPQLSTILTEPANKRNSWQDSLAGAKRMATREGKPLLLWFTDSVRSPLCKVLSQELFETQDFEKWAKENLIRVRVDASGEVSDSTLSLDQKESMRVSLKNYAKDLKSRYKVLGHPSLVLLQPNGQVVDQYRGYKSGQSEMTFGLIKQGVSVAQAAYKEWRSDMEQKGYRDWHDRKGRSVFAKLNRYQAETLILIEPDGARSRTTLRELCDVDQNLLKQGVLRSQSAH